MSQGDLALSCHWLCVWYDPSCDTPKSQLHTQNRVPGIL